MKANPGVKLTYEDYLHFPDDGKRHELIDGEHYVTPTPIRKHQAIAGNLHGMIWSHLQDHSVGRVYTAPFDVWSDIEDERFSLCHAPSHCAPPPPPGA